MKRDSNWVMSWVISWMKGWAIGHPYEKTISIAFSNFTRPSLKFFIHHVENLHSCRGNLGNCKKAGIACLFVKEFLPHNFHPFPVLELVRGGVGEGVFAADKGAIDAVGFNGGDCGAVLPMHPDAFGAAGVAGGCVRCARLYRDGVGRYGEVVVADKAVVGGGPFGAASAVECGEVELVDFHGVVVAEPEGIHVQYEFAV